MGDNYVWGGSFTGDWDDAVNWTDATTGGTATTPPNADDSVTINAARLAITISGTGSSNSLTIVGNGGLEAESTAIVLSGTFTTGALTVDDDSILTVNTGASLTVNSSANLEDDRLNVNGGTLTVNGATTFSGAISVTAGTLNFNDDVTESDDFAGFNISASSVTISGSLKCGAFESGWLSLDDSIFTVGGLVTSSTQDGMAEQNLLGLLVDASDQSRVQFGNIGVASGGALTLFTDATSSIEIGTTGGAEAGSVTIDAGVNASASGEFAAPNIVVNGTLTVIAGGSSLHPEGV